MLNHEKYLRRCLELARLGNGNVAPNPLVGAVIVHKGTIIGEGFHQKFGGPHAEVNAINAVQNKGLLKDATIYVSFEPCSHFGKTPPCSDLIIEMGIPHVVIASVDANPTVCGNGIKKLEASGIKVEYGFLEKEASELNKAFNIFHTRKRPMIILKWAQTKDGYIDAIRKSKSATPLQITQSPANRLVHKMRREVDAIVIGSNTALLDNPSLTTRNYYGPNPLRVIIDPENELLSNLKLFNDEVPTLIFNKTVAKKMGHIEYVSFEGDLNYTLVNKLYSRKIQSVLVEGGAFTLNNFLKLQLWDTLYVFESDFAINEGIKAPEINILPQQKFSIGNDKLYVYENI